jgi:hypothetical protein
MELCWSMAQATLFSVLAILLWAAFDHPGKSTLRFTDYLGTLNVLILTSWVVLIAGKFWDGKVGDPWPRRTILLTCGLGLGAISGFLAPSPNNVRSMQSMELEQHTLWLMVHHAFFFGIGLFALSWWKLTARHRTSRFSFWSVIVTGVASFLLLKVVQIPNEKAIHDSFDVSGLTLPPAVVVLTLTSVVVQLASPWAGPVPKLSKRLRWKAA